MLEKIYASGKSLQQSIIITSRILVFWLFGITSIQAQIPSIPSIHQSTLPVKSVSTGTLDSDPSSLPQQNVIPPGTILPVRLRTNISAEKSKSGQVIVGRIAQDVPLSNGSKIPEGSKVEGKVVEVIPAGAPSGPRISIRFDRVRAQGKTIPVTTNMRAIAGFMEIMEAGLPDFGASEGDPPNWWTTTQVGGDAVFGAGGPVSSHEDSSKIVGRSVTDGVLAEVNAKAGTKCRGPIAGNANPQPLWVFSSDACGVYGIEHLQISHAGRTAPEGTIVLTSETPTLMLRNGDGLLLRVD